MKIRRQVPAPCRLLLLCLVFFLPSVTVARQTLIFEDTTRSRSATEALSLLSSNEFEALEGLSYNAGYSHSVFWIALKITDGPLPRKWIVGNPHVNRIDYYYFAPGSSKPTHVITGDHYPFSQRPAVNRQFVFDASKNGIYLARIDKNGESLQLHTELLSRKAYHSAVDQENVLNGIYLGAITLMILFATFLCITVGERLYFYYIIYIITSYTWVMANKGYGYMYLWPDFPEFASLARPFFNVVCCIAMLFFMQHFIRQDKGSRYFRINQGLKIACGILALCILLPLVFPGLMLLTTGLLIALQVLIGLILISTTLSIIEKIREGNRQALFFLLSIVLLLLFVLAEFLVHAGITVIKNDFLANFGMQTGFVCEALILLFGLAFQLNSYRTEREKLLISINEQQRGLSASIIETQENERRLIADQLHDEVGAQLSVVALQLGTVAENNVLDATNSARLAKATEVLQDVAHTIRNLSHILTPVAIEKFGFAKSIEDLAKAINLSQKLDVECILVGFKQDSGISLQILITLYRISQELLNNTLKHAGANHALLQLVEHDESITLFYEDDGIGLTEGARKDGKGLTSIASRIAFYDGQCEILSPPPGGIIVNIEIPNIKK